MVAIWLSPGETSGSAGEAMSGILRLARKAAGPEAWNAGACALAVLLGWAAITALVPILLDAVARANRCEAVWNEALGFSTVVGFEADLEVVELLHTSLLVQATTAMTKAEAAQRKGGRKRTKTFRQSFLAAYAHRIGDRLAAVAEAQVAEARAADAEAGGGGGAGGPDQDLLPVLAARDVAVHDEFSRMFPDTVTTWVVAPVSS